MRAFGRTIVVAAAICLSPGGAWAVYKCADGNGRIAFQDTPCPGAGTQFDVKPAGGIAPAREHTSSSNVPQSEADRLERIVSDSQKQRRKLEIEARLLPDAEAAMRTLRNQCDGQMAALRAQKGAANNNLAGATWEVSLSGEMSAVATRCDTRQRELRQDYDALARECAALAGCKR
ncbi:DUF4124 domain-containing protein [Ramlibacter alkalitolerans]|uniref:DUF4124 domain-containing protein n=1 Tax=Ramlibacter alkalitolerans TaxID=2039631 RepID=A0ABS1JUQ3_9BURK|nr:DUF4124 domain-containing protein [Ramlibacter alkalitolerans]MBL0427947.1 DUF4124 domain-containing protein [Ramlibacter alkalitolerans]